MLKYQLHFHHIEGGTGNVCYSYSLELAKLGHEVTVFTSSTKEDGEYLDESKFKVKRFNPLFKIGNAPFIPQLMFIKGFDIVHLHYPFFFGSEFIFLLYLIQGQKYIITYQHDVILDGWVGFFLKFYKKLIMNLILINATKVCVSSLDYAYHSEIKDVVKKENIIEISNGVDLKNFSSNRSCEELKEKKIHENNLLLFVRSMDKAHYFKGVDYLINSFKRIVDKRQNISLILIGDGELKENYPETHTKTWNC